VAVYLALRREHLAFERMGLRITDNGFSTPDDSALRTDVATNWVNLNAYLDFLVQRLLE